MEQICKAVELPFAAVKDVLLHDLLDSPYTCLQGKCKIDHVHRLAQYIGIPMNMRVYGALLWFLDNKPMKPQVASTYISREFNVHRKTCQGYIDELIQSKHLSMLCGYILHPDDAMALRTIAKHVESRSLVPWEPHTSTMEIQPHCRRALDMIVYHPISIITGPPGTGKSHFTTDLMSICRDEGRTCRITAPTAHMSIAQETARTVTSFVTIQEANEEHFACDILVIDEASMLSAQLFAKVLNMAPSSTRIVLVGDTNQLPPIGVGNVLRDLLDYRVPSVEFGVQYRQSQGLEAFADCIRTGDVDSIQTTLNACEQAGETEFVPCESWESVITSVPEAFMFTAMDEATEGSTCMTLVPTRQERNELNTAVQLYRHAREECDITLKLACDTAPKGTRGIAYLESVNTTQTRPTYRIHVLADEDVEFRATLPAATALISIDPRAGGVGVECGAILPHDPVVITRTTSTQCLGDLGVFAGGNSVKFPGKKTVGTDTGVDENSDGEHSPGIMLAYASTVHKAQGAEFESVIVPIVRPYAWTREMLYTAVTRARDDVVILGTVEDLAEIMKRPIIQQPPYLITALEE
jgi:exodeoxyribonuclease V alpha subunit